MQLNPIESSFEDEPFQRNAKTKWEIDGHYINLTMSGPITMTNQQFIDAMRPIAEDAAKRMTSAPKPLS